MAIKRSAALLGLCFATAAQGSDPPQRTAYGALLSEGWRVQAGYGTLEVDGADDTGRAATIGLANGAHVTNDRGHHWDFEVGLAYTQTDDHPEGPGGETIRINQTDLYYQARRLLGESPWFLGWHAAGTRTSIQPADGDSERDLDITVGAIAGYRGHGRFGFQVEALATDPEPSFSDLALDYKTRQYRGSLHFRF